MMEIVIRLVLQVAIAAVLFWARFIDGESAQNVAIAFYLPYFLGLPALFLSLAILAPAERWLDRTGRVDRAVYILVPLIAALSPLVMLPFAGSWGNFLSGMLSLSTHAFQWGCLWMATRPVYRAVFRKPDTQ